MRENKTYTPRDSSSYKKPGSTGSETGAGGFAAAKPTFRPRRTCPFSGPNAIPVDYKDLRTLAKFVTERGRIMPRRITYVTAKPQRALATAIKRARFLALMAYIVK